MKILAPLTLGLVLCFFVSAFAEGADFLQELEKLGQMPMDEAGLDALQIAGEKALNECERDACVAAKKKVLKRDEKTGEALPIERQTQIFDKETVRALEKAQKQGENADSSILQNMPDIPPAKEVENRPANEALTQLLAAKGGANTALDEETGETLLFVGQSAECSEGGANFRNCCKKKGWGLDLSLAHCNKQEKELGEARSQGRAIQVGRFCAHHSFLGCTSHHESWCIFPSKLARIIQEQGRLKQLGISFGHGHHPDCSGIRPDDYKGINFSQIDLTAAFSETSDMFPQLDSMQSNFVTEIGKKAREEER